jgi:diamine N-acetyltransferase
MSQIVEIKTEKEIDILLITINKSSQNTLKERLVKDFYDKKFKGFLLCESSDDSDDVTVDGYLIYYYSYSTWQDRVLYISNIWFNETSKNKDEKFKRMIQHLKSIAASEECKRINLNLPNLRQNEYLIEQLTSNGALNIGKIEDWSIFELGLDEMKLLTTKLEQNLPQNFSIRKVNDIEKDSVEFLRMIRELAIYEDMLEQVEITEESIIRDWNNYYQLFLVIKTDIDANNDEIESIIGYAMFYGNYELERGCGCYLEDLFILKEYRGKGLGTQLWARVVEDCLFDSKYFQFAALNWNKPSIEFYLKNKAINITERDRIDIFRFPTKSIRFN